jgi:hypothetical protein
MNLAIYSKARYIEMRYSKELLKGNTGLLVLSVLGSNDLYGYRIIRELEIRSENAYILDRCEEVELKDGSWAWSEILKAGDVLANGETVKDVIIKPFKVLVGIETNGPVTISGKLQGKTVYIIQGSDYSAQEPRLLSQLCADEGMLQAYRDGKDLYCEIASISFKRPYKKCLEHL